MIGSSKESRIGLIGTIVVHLVLFLICFFYTLNTNAKVPDYVELSFTSNEVITPVEEVSETVAQKEGAILTKSSTITTTTPKVEKNKSLIASSTEKTIPRITPPKYNISLDDGEVKLPDSKMDITASPNAKYESGAHTSSIESKKESFVGNKKEDKLTSDGASSSVKDIGNSSIGKEIKNYSILWRDGGVRNKISGILPKYPENTNKEAQVKLQITVSPDGEILKIIPLQKADYVFENSAISALRTWKFEKLKSNQPLENQIGIITFNFKLE